MKDFMKEPVPNEPEKIRIHKIGKTEYKVSSFYNKDGTDTLKNIIKRKIERDLTLVSSPKGVC